MNQVKRIPFRILEELKKCLPLEAKTPDFKIPIPIDNYHTLTIETVPKSDWIGLFRWTFSNFGPMPEDKISL